MIHVIAEIWLVERTQHRFLEEFSRLAPLVRAEDGCLEYVSAVDIDSGLRAGAPPRPDLVSVIEKWRDLAALEVHLKAPHMADHRSRVGGLVVETVIRVLRPAGEPG